MDNLSKSKKEVKDLIEKKYKKNTMLTGSIYLFKYYFSFKYYPL